MPSLSDVVLLVTHSGDYFTVDRVADALIKRGARVFRLDTDLFPEQIQLTAQISDRNSIYTIERDGNCINSEEVCSVWMRRIWQPKLSEVAPQYRSFCIKESSATLADFWDSLRQARWLDDLTQIRAAENKIKQLRIAREVGLQIARTAIANNPEVIREFFDRVAGKMVAKLIRPLSTSMNGNSIFCYTNTVREQDLENLDSLVHSPMIFQEQIPKERELRIVFVNGNFFVGSLTAAEYAESIVDWRRASAGGGSWQSEQLPNELKSRLKAFMAQLNLVFGVFDFIKTPTGEYIFLEVNPVGEWGMLEKELGCPISEAIADVLMI